MNGTILGILLAGSLLGGGIAQPSIEASVDYAAPEFSSYNLFSYDISAIKHFYALYKEYGLDKGKDGFSESIDAYEQIKDAYSKLSDDDLILLDTIPTDTGGTIGSNVATYFSFMQRLIKKQESYEMLLRKLPIFALGGVGVAGVGAYAYLKSRQKKRRAK